MATKKTSAARGRSIEETPADLRPEPRAPRLTARKAPTARAAQPDTTALAEHIRIRAYYLSLERNGHAADPVADWLVAEREMTVLRSPLSH